MSKFKKVTHLICDMDGTLLDTETLYNKMFTDIAAKYRKVFTTEVLVKLMGTNEKDSAKVMVDALSLPITADQFLEQQRALQTALLPNAELMPGVDRLIRHFHKHGVKMAVATSSSLESVALKTKKHKEFFSLFAHLVSGTSDPEVKNGKPKPDIFLVCASRFPDKPKPQQCLVIEDAPNGVTAAVAAGMQVVMVPAAITPREKCTAATLVLPSLEQFKPELFGLPPF